MYHSVKKILFKVQALILVAVFLNFTQACSTFKVVTSTKVDEKKLNTFALKGKYFIVHENDTAWHLSDPRCGDNKLIGEKQVLPEWHKTYKSNPLKKNNPFDRKDSLQKQVAKEFHIYATQVQHIDSSWVFIPLESIVYTEIYQAQNKALAPIILGTGGLILIIVLISAAVSSMKLEGNTSWHI